VNAANNRAQIIAGNLKVFISMVFGEYGYLKITEHFIHTTDQIQYCLINYTLKLNKCENFHRIDLICHPVQRLFNHKHCDEMCLCFFAFLREASNEISTKMAIFELS
jgi:hypothetical protein